MTAVLQREEVLQEWALDEVHRQLFAIQTAYLQQVIGVSSVVSWKSAAGVSAER